MYDNKEEQSLDDYEGKKEREDLEYIILFYITHSPCRKKLNHSTDMDEEIRSLNHLVYILKIGL